jgi:hypothetical protein
MPPVGRFFVPEHSERQAHAGRGQVPVVDALRPKTGGHILKAPHGIDPTWRMRDGESSMKSAILASVLVAAFATTASAQSVGGSYQVSGKNFNGSSYSGTAEIAFSSNNNCRINWVTGSTTLYGSCMRKGTSFAAGYVLGGVPGLVMYELRPDGRLEGTWTLANQPGIGTETLTPMR